MFYFMLEIMNILLHNFAANFDKVNKLNLDLNISDRYNNACVLPFVDK